MVGPVLVPLENAIARWRARSDVRSGAVSQTETVSPVVTAGVTLAGGSGACAPAPPQPDVPSATAAM